MRRIPISQIPNVSALLKKHFFAGLLTLIPLLVIAYILGSVVSFLWELHRFLPEEWQPGVLFSDPVVATLFNIGFTVAVALLLALGVSVLGWVSRQYLGRKVLEWIAEVIQHIPVIRSIYSALDQLLKTFASDGNQQFSRVVYIEYPRKGTWALAFVTSPARGLGDPGQFLNVYVPTTPNPTSGFHLIVAESEVRDSNLSVEEAFKTIISLGIAQPSGKDGRG